MAGIWEPLNSKRLERANELKNQITDMQKSAINMKEITDKMDVDLSAKVEEYLKAHNLYTFDEVRENLLGKSTLSAADKEKYDKLFRGMEAKASFYHKSMQITTVVFLGSTGLNKIIDIPLFFKACQVLTVIKCYGAAFVITLTKGLAAGKQAFRAVNELVKDGMKVFKAENRFGKWAAGAQKWLKRIAIVGVALDVILLGFDIAEEIEQKEKLQKAIKDLYVQRITTKFFWRLCEGAKIIDATIDTYLDFEEDMTPKLREKTALKIRTKIEQQWTGIDAASSHEMLVIDDNKDGSWTQEDPTREYAIKAATEAIGKPKIPESNSGSAAAMLTTISFAPPNLDTFKLPTAPIVPVYVESSAVPTTMMSFAPPDLDTPKPPTAPTVPIYVEKPLKGNELEAELKDIDEIFAEYDLPEYSEEDASVYDKDPFFETINKMVNSGTKFNADSFQDLLTCL